MLFNVICIVLFSHFVLDFHELFPHISVSGSNITIITLHEKRNSAMLGSDPVDSSLKRIQLVEQVCMCCLNV